MTDTFYPFVENGSTPVDTPTLEVHHAARIAVFDDAAAAPRVVVIEPQDIRSYLEEITATVTKLAQEQGGSIPFTVIREVVENLIHAYFIEPTISILDGGNTIRFSDQGPGIQDKDRALEYGTTSATTEMKRYIRGVGSGLPYAQQWLEDKGGSLSVEDNIHRGTVVTISLAGDDASDVDIAYQATQMQQAFSLQQSYQPGYQQQPQTGMQTYPQQMQPMMQTYPQQSQPGMPAYPQQAFQQGIYPPQGYQQNAYAQTWPGYQQSPYQQAPMQAAAPISGVSERGLFALQYLLTHESVGPRDLNALQRLSESTWSRELTQLETQGLISKQGGQKRRLTPAGRVFLGLPPQ